MSDTTQHAGDNIRVANLEIEQLKAENAELKALIKRMLELWVRFISTYNPEINEKQVQLVKDINSAFRDEVINPWWGKD